MAGLFFFILCPHGDHMAGRTVQVCVQCVIISNYVFRLCVRNTGWKARAEDATSALEFGSVAKWERVPPAKVT